MAKITYIEFNGTEHVVDVEAGLTLMEGAVRNSVPGIEAQCGGNCACATCHVYVDEAWAAKLRERDEMESSMLDGVNDVDSRSRLSCQVRVTDDLDGMVVHLPERQG